MNIAIVDDLRSDADQLRTILMSYAYENSLDLSIEVFSGGEEFLYEYHKKYGKPIPIPLSSFFRPATNSCRKHLVSMPTITSRNLPKKADSIR